MTNDAVHRRNPYRSELWCEPVPGHGLEEWPQRERDISVALSNAIWWDQHWDPYLLLGYLYVGPREQAVLDAIHKGVEYLPHYMVW